MTDGERDIRYDPQAKPGVSNLLTLQSALTGTPVTELEQAYSGHGYGHLKAQTAEAVIAVVEPFHQRMNELLDDPSELDRILSAGAERARDVASGTLARVRERVGLLARSPDQTPASGLANRTAGQVARDASRRQPATMKPARGRATTPQPARPIPPGSFRRHTGSWPGLVVRDSRR